MNPFPALTVPTPLTPIVPYPQLFLLNLYNIEEVALIANLGKTSLTKGIARSIDDFWPELPIILPNVHARNPLD